jgi:hypothetical protein
MIIGLHKDQHKLIACLIGRQEAIGAVPEGQRNLNETCLLSILESLLCGVRCHDVDVPEARKKFPVELIPLFEEHNNAIASLVSEFPELERKVQQKQQECPSGVAELTQLDPSARKCLEPYL